MTAAAQDAPASGEFNHVSVEISDMEITEAMQVLSDATGFNILLSSKVTGKITAYILDMEPERALREVIEVNGFRYVRNENVVWVLTQEEYLEDHALGRERVVVQLRYARPEQLLPLLTENLSKSAVVQIYPETSTVVVAEVKERAEDVRTLIAQLDSPSIVRVFQLQHASAVDLLNIIEPHVTSMDSLRADPRTNQIVISGTPETIERLGELIGQFDIPDKVSTRVFKLKYANAESVAGLLEEVLTGRRRSSTQQSSGGMQDNSREQPRVFTTLAGPGTSANPDSTWRRFRSPRTESPVSTPAADVAPPTAAALPADTGGTAATAATSQQGSAPMPEALGESSIALGPLANVTADSRTNSVIVTHVQSVLGRLEQVVLALDVPGEYHTYEFQHVNPGETGVQEKLALLVTGEDAFLQVDEIARKVTFRATADKAEEILSILKEWDQPVRQVSIAAEILRVNASLIRELGINWQALTREISDSTGESVMDSAAEILFPAAVGDNASQGRFTLGNLENDDYRVILQAIENDNDTEVVATPKILVQDNGEASFSSVRDEPYTVVTVDGNTQTTLEDVRFINVGTTLQVAPRIFANDDIALDVQLELSNLVEIRNGIPVTDRATAQSTVTMRDKGTVILGGLRQSSRINVQRGVPGLNKLPVLGSLFRSKRRDKAESEIILVLRPEIIGDAPAITPSVDVVSNSLREAVKPNVLVPQLHQTASQPPLIDNAASN